MRFRAPKKLREEAAVYASVLSYDFSPEKGDVPGVSDAAVDLFWEAMRWHMYRRADGQRFDLNNSPPGECCFSRCYAEIASVLLNGD